MGKSGLFLATVIAVAVSVTGCAPVGDMDAYLETRRACVELDKAAGDLNLSQHEMLAAPLKARQKFMDLAEEAKKHPNVAPGLGEALEVFANSIPVDMNNVTQLDKALIDAAAQDLDRAVDRMYEICG